MASMSRVAVFIRLFRMQVAIAIVFLSGFLYGVLSCFVHLDSDTSNVVELIAAGISAILFVRELGAAAPPTLRRVPWIKRVAPGFVLASASVFGFVSALAAFAPPRAPEVRRSTNEDTVRTIRERELPPELRQSTEKESPPFNAYGGVIAPETYLGWWWWTRRRTREPQIAFFRSFDARVSKATRTEIARSLASFGRLSIVNDGQNFDLDTPLFIGPHAFEALQPQNQVFLPSGEKEWEPGVGTLIRSAEVLVVDVTVGTPGLKWEVEQVLAQEGTATLFLARYGRPDPDLVQKFCSDHSSEKAPRLGSLSRPLAYADGYLSALAFRIRLMRSFSNLCTEMDSA